MDSQSTALAVTPYEEMERADEEMVLSEIKGRAIDTLVYEIVQGGQKITGLSLAGVRETVRSMNANGRARIGVSDREPLITETDDYFEIKVYAEDKQNGGGYWGIKRQPKRYQDRNGNWKENGFALEQALAKAQRNAMRGLIPEYFVKEMIEAWKNRGQVKTIGHNAATNPGIGRTAEGHATQPQAERGNGKESKRPYSAPELRDFIHIVSQTRFGNATLMPQGQQGLLVNKLDELCGDTMARHEFLEYVTGQDSIKTQPVPMLYALERWANGEPEVVKQEAARVLTQHAKDRGQMELAEDAKPEETK